eukprot:6713222-Alexandrium_andersonii.AAC.1
MRSCAIQGGSRALQDSDSCAAASCTARYMNARRSYGEENLPGAPRWGGSFRAARGAERGRA